MSVSMTVWTMYLRKSTTPPGPSQGIHIAYVGVVGKKCVFLSQWIHVSEFADRRWVENVANVDDLKKGGKESRFAHSIEARIDTYARKSQARRGRGRGGDPRGKFEMAIAVAANDAQITYVFVLEACENLDFAQRSLAIGLMFERADFLDCDAFASRARRRSKARDER